MKVDPDVLIAIVTVTAGFLAGFLIHSLAKLFGLDF